jgi:hypothetical protein
MPRIEDGDNFGVQVQEEVLSELLRSQESAYNLRDGIRQDHLARAKICSKLIKYPHVEDYALALKAHDDKQLYFARQNLLDLRNIYAVITDIVHKNIKKVSRCNFRCRILPIPPIDSCPKSKQRNRVVLSGNHNITPLVVSFAGPPIQIIQKSF